LKNKTDLLLGFTVGIITSVFGCFLFIQLFTKFTFIAGVELLQAEARHFGETVSLHDYRMVAVMAVQDKLIKMNK
jgi:hypothetical protein